ncbi:MAG: hypothetical protein VKJ04_03325 [Vampirovibrionales bacterium]|nr:hypothetical protein [Vampirovibrionales bacterium]
MQILRLHAPSTKASQRFWLSLLLSTCLIISSGCQANPLQNQKEKAAEDKLNQILGEKPPEDLAPLSPTPSPEQMPDTETLDSPSPFGALPNWAQKMLPGQPNIKVEEAREFYRVFITLENPKDANSVKLNVMPHQIQISGQSSFGKEGMQGSSSFFKSFSTQSELLSEQVKREDMPSQENKPHQLVFLIPKKAPSEPLKKINPASQPNQSNKPLAKQKTNLPDLPPDVLEQLDSTDGRAI